MSRLIIILDIDLDRTVEDPHNVAEEFFPACVGERFRSSYGEVQAIVMSAEWEE